MAASEDLLRLDVEQTCNTPDGDIIDNLRASKVRDWVKWLDVETNIKDKPLVICGSGPSAWEALKAIPTGYDLMALNGAYNALRSIGMIPDYYVQLDARPFNVPFVSNPHSSTKFYLAAQVHPEVYDALKGQDVTSFHLHTETSQIVFGGESGTFMGCPAGTVGMCALGLAGVLGYRKLIILGFDSSYRAEQSHMVAQPQNIGQAMLRVEFNGKWYVTTPTMAKQVMEFFEWSKALHQAFSGLEIHLAGEGLFYDYIITNQNLTSRPTTREEELARYPDIYAADPEYKCTDIRLAGLQEALNMTSKGTYLDVSCGRGESLHLADCLGFDVASGTETVPALIGGRVGHGILPNLPVPDKSYDVVSLIEVIEHLVPDDVEPALRELDRIARKNIIISAATFPSWRNGANLHPSARSESEWHKLFVKVWGDKVTRLPFNIHPSPAWMVTC